MISVNEAKNKIGQTVQPLAPVLLSLHDAAGLVLAEDVFAPENLPRFAQSAMDGYAFRFEDLQHDKKLPVLGAVAAGDADVPQLQQGTAVRIFTGAPLPAGANVVVMQEKTVAGSGYILIEDDQLQEGTNVRAIGSEIKQGQLALPKGTKMSAGAIGLAASMGITHLSVLPAPKVTLLVTGKELVQPGAPLTPGQVYESNSFALTAALKKMNIPAPHVVPVDDTLESVTTCLNNALQESDLILLTGGVSVGDYDFVVAASKQCGVETVFHKIAQKPGKPLLFGSLGNKVVFGLPGNPGSVLTCFYQYVLPAIGCMMKQELACREVELTLAAPLEKKRGLTHFVKGIVQGEEALPLGAQESYRMSSFVFADCLIELDASSENVPKGSKVKAYLLPV